MDSIRLLLFVYFVSLTNAFSGASMPKITSELLKLEGDEARIFEGTITGVEKIYLLKGREYRISKEQFEKLKMDAYLSDEMEESLFYQLRILHRFTLQVVRPISENVTAGDEIVLEVVDHPDSMCPHFRAFPSKDRMPDYLPEPNVWMIYWTKHEQGILREEHALLSREDWQKLLE
ncbi:MAG: hypothetical protein Q7Q71_03535 [Verrucomicrobiota bacterium JB023]|nr:hypothetical protein [Verrucomicrobiota bacterium JB023]